MRPYRYFLLFILLSMLISGVFVSSTHAQENDQAFARIDDALADLSIQLGQTQTRSNTEWRWTERTYPDTSLGCPDPNAVYTQVQTVGLSITLGVDGVDYNYRSTKDGSIFFQCVDGRPLGSSTPAPTPSFNNPPNNTPVIGGAIQSLPPSEWWAWTFSNNEDRLYLINVQGEQVSMARPLPANKILDPNSIQNPAISRNSQYMVFPYQLANGNAAFGIYNVATAQFVKVHEALAGESIELGFWVNTSGTPFIFDETGAFVAVAFSNLNFEDPSQSTWRIGIYELATGNAVYFIDNTHPNIPLQNVDLEFTFPRIAYFGDDALHVQMVYAFGEGAYDTPAFVWHPNANYFEISPYNQINMDISPLSGDPVFAYMDNSFTSVEPFSPAVPFNAIGSGDHTAPTRLWIDGTNMHASATWTAGEDMVLYRTYSGPEDFGRWNVFAVANNTATILDASIDTIAPLPSGFLGASNAGQITYHSAQAPLQGQPVWQAPLSGYAQVIWTSQPDIPFGLTSITIPGNTTTFAPPTVVPTPAQNTSITNNNNCGTAPPVRMTLNTRGRVTYTDGTPTRLRQSPNGTIIEQMVEGTPFTIMGGPLCSNPFNWWQIQLDNGQQGWVAEGSTNIYFIEPLP